MTLYICVDMSEPRVMDVVSTTEKKQKTAFLNRARNDQTASPSRTLHIIQIEKEGITHSPLEEAT